MRLFIALDPSEQVRARFAALLRQLKAEAPAVKWVAAESLHLTLKFIGEQPEEKLPGLAEALAAVAPPGHLGLCFRGLGCFPNERRPRVFWVGMEELPELARLAAAIERALEPFGIAPEGRPFSPHLTLGRLREGARLALLPQAWEANRAEEFGRVLATEYTKLRSFPLQAG